jgi:hypothetical protein
LCDDGHAIRFALLIMCVLGAADSSTLFFQPFETKSRLFEFKVASDLSDHHVIPGSYFAAGSFAWHWAGFDTIMVTR